MRFPSLDRQYMVRSPFQTRWAAGAAAGAAALADRKPATEELPPPRSCGSCGCGGGDAAASAHAIAREAAERAILADITEGAVQAAQGTGEKVEGKLATPQ
mmetsp:Transcript_98966/g.262898  ORF Transcript_98966/g.262898 Transcript_98966/m.262898 type:complete len:101 (-) Transcript_98966:18-320(-)